MNLIVPSFTPALPFGPAVAAGPIVDESLLSLADGSLGLTGDFVALISLVPCFALVPLLGAVFSGTEV